MLSHWAVQNSLATVSQSYHLLPPVQHVEHMYFTTAVSHRKLNFVHSVGRGQRDGKIRETQHPVSLEHVA